MAYSPKAIANYFLELANAQLRDLTPLKLQKLVYFANGWHLAIKSEPLINEQVEAWKFGPVIPSLYRAFRHYRDQPVTEPASAFEFEYDEDGDWVTTEEITPTVDDCPQEAEFTKALLRRVWEIYGKYTAIQLSNLTHQDGSPWHTVYVQYHGEIPRGTDIPRGLMREYFLGLVRAKATAQ